MATDRATQPERAGRLVEVEVEAGRVIIEVVGQPADEKRAGRPEDGKPEPLDVGRAWVHPGPVEHRIVPGDHVHGRRGGGGSELGEGHAAIVGGGPCSEPRRSGPRADPSGTGVAAGTRMGLPMGHELNVEAIVVISALGGPLGVVLGSVGTLEHHRPHRLRAARPGRHPSAALAHAPRRGVVGIAVGGRAGVGPGPVLRRRPGQPPRAPGRRRAAPAPAGHRASPDHRGGHGGRLRAIGGIGIWVAALVGAIVAPTDAALGSAIMGDTGSPAGCAGSSTWRAGSTTASSRPS